ncbi:MAG: lipopolysaccharide biosynthesis protein [Stappia sp.]|jgi:capsular polysaccharide transport system permease protein|uniref:lipopolysaccharide biosynthesis protein n=1 Tax=Stappia sp. TaxID=1870903 RepID=UPI000C60708D|nr:lipopolysaccharide biosynthesis protein [Stappia sp.]MBM19051.1 lipopolysaccharide biosynthesis protein [Stappia sp.]
MSDNAEAKPVDTKASGVAALKEKTGVKEASAGGQVADKAAKEPRVVPLRIDRAAAAIVRKAEQNIRPQGVRRLILKASFVLCVLIPTLLGAAYFLLIASDRYVAGASFSVRSMDNTVPGGDFLGAISGLSSVGTTTTDSFILLQYLHSREIVEKVEKEFDLRAAFSRPGVDFAYRLDPQAPIEDLVDYWRDMVSPSYDNTSAISKFEVQAFTPADAEAIAALVVKHSQDLINRLSAQAREDAVQFAKRETASAELRLKVIRDRMRQFRTSSSAVDPAASAAAQVELVASIEGRLVELRARLGTLESSLSDDAPSVVQLRKQIAALEQQLLEKQTEVNEDVPDPLRSGGGLSALLSDYEKLKVDLEFAQKAYAASLSALERARAEADRQQRFLAVFESPSVPELALYPYRYIDTALVFIVSLILWGIGVLLAYSIRDNMQ